MSILGSEVLVAERPSSLFLELNGRRIAQILLLLSLLAAVAQLMMGASPLVLAVLMIGIALGFYGFVALGEFNIASWVAFFYLMGNVLIALFAKTLLWQPIDSFLYAPLGSFGAESASVLGLLLALLLVNRLNLGDSLLEPSSDPGFLRFLSSSTFVLGVVLSALNFVFLDPSEGNGFGGIAIFRDLLIMSVIARTAMLLEQSHNRESFDVLLGLMMAVGVIVGLISNGKTATALPVVGYIATLIFYRRGVNAKLLTLFIVAGVLFVGIFGPMIHAYRIIGQQGLSLTDNVDFLVSNTGRLIDNPQKFHSIEKLASGAFKRGYYDYFGVDGSGQMLLGRYAMVQAIDPVIYEANRHGVRGGDALWPAFMRHIPRFIYPDKPEYGESYYTLLHFRLVHPDGGKFPTLPLAGQAYAAYGPAGVLFVPFLTFLMFFVVLKKIGWGLYRNVYAIFFLASFVVVFVNQGDVSQYAGAALRNFPLFVALFWLISHLFQYKIRLHKLRY